MIYLCTLSADNLGTFSARIIGISVGIYSSVQRDWSKPKMLDHVTVESPPRVHHPPGPVPANKTGGVTASGAQWVCTSYDVVRKIIGTSSGAVSGADTYAHVVTSLPRICPESLTSTLLYLACGLDLGACSYIYSCRMFMQHCGKGHCVELEMVAAGWSDMRVIRSLHRLQEA